MPTKFAKGDEVRVNAKKFDGDGETDELGLKWSERWSFTAYMFLLQLS